MEFAIFHHDPNRIFSGKRGVKGPFGHRFGGPADYSGLAAYKAQPPVHLLFRLNTADARVGVTIPGATWLPLLCAIRYGACDLGYRVLSDDRVHILHQSVTKAWKGFPSADYPAVLPGKPVGFGEVGYDPADPHDALCFSGVFGYDALTTEQYAALSRVVVEEGLYDPDDPMDYETPEDFVREGIAFPFVQGPPMDGCPDPSCRRHGVTRALRTFAIFQEDDKKSKNLWGRSCENLQIIYQICPACGAIRTTNQCT
jgi:hypothetical protein